MTAEEALKLMQKNEPARVFGTEDYCDAYAIAENALEKQIPKRVQYTIDRSWGVETKQPVCPMCDYYLSRFEFIGDGKKMSYCEHCGQAIEWSD